MQEPYKPPKNVNNWIHYFLGLTIGVGLGLSPYLGLLNVPLFRPLLELIPLNLQNTLIPLSSAAMGVIAAAVQWFTGERISNERLNRLFIRCLCLCVFAFFALTVVHTIFVVTVQIKDAQESVSFLVGYSRPNIEPCLGSVSDEACIEMLSLNPARISSFWGDRQIRVARILLFGSYLFFTSLFGIIIGLIVIREKMGHEYQSKSKKRVKKTAKRLVAAENNSIGKTNDLPEQSIVE